MGVFAHFTPFFEVGVFAHFTPFLKVILKIKMGVFAHFTAFFESYNHNNFLNDLLIKHKRCKNCCK